MEMLFEAGLPSGTSKKTWVWEKVCYPVGQMQCLQLELPEAVPVEASRHWRHCFPAGAWVQVLLGAWRGEGAVSWAAQSLASAAVAPTGVGSIPA